MTELVRGEKGEASLPQIAAQACFWGQYSLGDKGEGLRARIVARAGGLAGE